MRLLILSEIIVKKQRLSGICYTPPNDVQMHVCDLNDIQFSNFSVFDYDVTIVHIFEPKHNTVGYYCNLPKLLHDSRLALRNGRAVICLPHSRNFVSNDGEDVGPRAYEWLKHLGVELWDNLGEAIKLSSAGRAQVFEEYFKLSPKYFQIVHGFQTNAPCVLAVVDGTEIIVGMEVPIERGTLAILPPPQIEDGNFSTVMSQMIEVARRYYDRSQRQISLSDAPDWLTDYLVPRAKSLDDEIRKLTEQKYQFDKLAYVLYGTGDDLEKSVALLFEFLGLVVEPQPKGANIDLKAKCDRLGVRFAIEITGTKGAIQKDSNKVAQAWEFFRESDDTDERKTRLMIVANTQYHLDPKERTRESFSPNVLKLLGGNGVLLITTQQLFALWKAVYERQKTADHVIQRLYESTGIFDEDV